MEQNDSPQRIMQSSSPPEQNHTTLPSANLAKLGTIIDAELQSWLIHLSTIPKQTFTDLTSSGSSPQTKIAGLKHILSTLPERHKALVAAYNAQDVDQIQLSDQCATLLEGLKSEEKVDLGGFYNHQLFKGKRFRADVVAMEEEIRKLEQGRLEELKELMGMFEGMVILRDDRALGEEELGLLVGAMDHVGLSASSAVESDGVRG